MIAIGIGISFIPVSSVGDTLPDNLVTLNGSPVTLNGFYVVLNP